MAAEVMLTGADADKEGKGLPSQVLQASGIRAGTPGILRNILGERVLGSPKD